MLLHPIGLDLTFFDPLVELLAPSCHILRIDSPGHGESPALPETPSLKDYANAIHGLLQHLQFAPATLAGFSFGGMLAQVLALDYPQDVEALSPCACPSTLESAGRKAMADRGALALEKGMTAVLEPTLQRWFTPEFRARGGDALALQRLLTDDPRSWAQAWGAISQLETRPRLAEIKVPTLCIAGELDPAAPPAVVKAMADAIPGAQFAVVPGGSHMFFIEQPEPVAKLIRNFLAAIRRGTQ